jgi:hypothetical protein
MTGNEKLKALLAEARRELGCIEALTVHPGVHNGPGGDALSQFLERIDAALAEPVGDALEWQTAVTKALSESQERLAAELKEAQAELKRLKKATHTWSCQRQSAYNLSCVCGADKEQRDREHAAYQRGAEAMREAAAEYVKNASHEDGLGMGSQRMESGIRALPTPEDKP